MTETGSVSRKKAEGRLRKIYENLQGMGFKQGHVEDALRAMKVAMVLTA